jgi:hypothetical protein
MFACALTLSLFTAHILCEKAQLLEIELYRQQTNDAYVLRTDAYINKVLIDIKAIDSVLIDINLKKVFYKPLKPI